MSDVSTNFAGKLAHQLFDFAVGKCCPSLSVFTRWFSENKEVLWPITNFEPST